MADTGLLPDQKSRTYLTFMRPASQVRGTDPDSPDYASDDTEMMRDRSWLCRVFAEGVPAVQDNVKSLLPQYTNEEEEDYKMRISFSSFRNYYSQACGSILGKVFAQPPQLKDDVPTSIADELEDADMNGNHWTVCARSLMECALNEGMSWLIVDYVSVPPENVGSLTLAEEKALGLRPYWVVVPQHRVLGIEYEYSNGVFKLTQFRYRESVREKSGKFGEKCVEQIRVISPSESVVYVQTENGREKGKWTIKQGGVSINTLGMVPAIPLNLCARSRYTATPPLENLAYMNLEHFQIRSDQRRALAVASFPILVSTGVQSQSVVKIGPMTSINLEDPQADMKWVESDGVHLKAGAEELHKLESDMRTFGLSFENPQMYATATGRNIDASDAIAPIQFWAILLKDVLEQALRIHATWKKLPEGGSVDVNTSFLKNMLSIEGLKLLLEALKEGALSPEGFLQRMKEYGLLSDDFDPKKDMEAAIAAIKKKMKAMPVPATKPGAPSNDQPGGSPPPTPA